MAENSTSKSNYSASTNGSTYEPSQASSNGPGASFNQEQQGFQLTIMSDYVDGQQQPKGQARFSAQTVDARQYQDINTSSSHIHLSTHPPPVQFS